MSKSELCRKYNISHSTLKRWIKPILKELEKSGYTRDCKIINPACLKIIYAHLGEP